MKGLAVDPNIIADDEILDIICAANAYDAVGLICESASRALAHTLLRAARYAEIPAELLIGKTLDLKIRFTKPTADDFAYGLAVREWEEE